MSKSEQYEIGHVGSEAYYKYLRSLIVTPIGITNTENPGIIGIPDIDNIVNQHLAKGVISIYKDTQHICTENIDKKTNIDYKVNDNNKCVLTVGNKVVYDSLQLCKFICEVEDVMVEKIDTTFVDH
jgi:hypothetical protein